MPLLHMMFILILVGVLLWAANTFIPMEARIKSILNFVVIIAVIFWLLNIFGVFGGLSTVYIGPHR